MPNEDRNNVLHDAPNQESATEKLERDIKTGEVWLIVINALLLITNIVIASIYYGQLGQMRKATEATQIAANAAKESAAAAKSSVDLGREMLTNTVQQFRTE